MKKDILIVSDLHLGLIDSKCEQFLEFIKDRRFGKIILNGDIIDGWALNRGAKWRNRYTKVLNKLLKLSKNTEIIWVRGNHDEFISEYIDMVFGNIKIVENYVLKIDGKKYFIFHGDIIDIFITKYKWLSVIGSIGYDFALFLNRFYNGIRLFFGLDYYSLSQVIKRSVKMATNHINNFEEVAIDIGRKNGCDGVICGHIHEPADKHINGYHYLNSGDWVENMSYIIINRKGEISVRNEIKKE
jgi:UDP-2,3-diacylglucosamine pyrophosphatase LpxH